MELGRRAPPPPPPWSATGDDVWSMTSSHYGSIVDWREKFNSIILTKFKNITRQMPAKPEFDNTIISSLNWDTTARTVAVCDALSLTILCICDSHVLFHVPNIIVYGILSFEKRVGVVYSGPSSRCWMNVQHLAQLQHLVAVSHVLLSVLQAHVWTNDRWIF